MRAAGFSITVQSASSAGTGFAAAAAAEDASAIWYNPAAMGHLSATNYTVVVDAIDTSFQFHNTGSTGAYALPGASDSRNAGGLAVAPQVYLSTGLNDSWRLGLALNTPFGLKTDYDAGWRGQLVALKSQSTAYNVGPSVAYKMSDALWIGAGLDWQRFTADLTNSAGPLGVAELKASDSAFGYNAGVAWNPAGDFSVSASYRSAISYRLRGHATFSADNALYGSSASADLTVPENAILGAFVPLSENWDVMTSVTWTRWSRLQNLAIVRTSASALGNAGSLITSLPFDWTDTVTVAAGVTYKMNPAWKLRFGLAHDPAASSDATRTPRLPDQSRWITGVGLRYTPWTHSTVDLAVTHDFIKDATVNDSVGGVPGNLVGTFKSQVNVLSVQYNQQL
jgi:long-chain fatty acid transport protein